jgi:hypothetical protein
MARGPVAPQREPLEVTEPASISNGSSWAIVSRLE